MSKIQHRLTNAETRMRKSSNEVIALLAEARAKITALEREVKSRPHIEMPPELGGGQDENAR